MPRVRRRKTPANRRPSPAARVQSRRPLAFNFQRPAWLANFHRGKIGRAKHVDVAKFLGIEFASGNQGRDPAGGYAKFCCGIGGS